MKYLSLLLVLFLVTFGLTRDARAQMACLAQINALHTIGEPYTKLDSIKILVRVHAAGGLNEQEHYFYSTLTGDSIDIRGCYSARGLAAYTPHTHIINFGLPTDTAYRIFVNTYSANAQCGGIFDSCKRSLVVRILPQPYIDSISIFPPNPTEDDVVMAVTHTSTTRPGKKLSLGYYTNMSSGDIYAKGCYAITDSFLQDEQYNDTLKLGKLRSGNYNFNFKAYLSDDTSVCGNRVDSSMMSKAFHVQPLLSAGSVGLDKILSIYPNPVSNTLYIRKQALVDIQSVQIRNMQGRVVACQQDTTYIDVSAFPKGMYFVQVVTSKGAVTLKFVKE